MSNRCHDWRSASALLDITDGPSPRLVCNSNVVVASRLSVENCAMGSAALTPEDVAIRFKELSSRH